MSTATMVRKKLISFFLVISLTLPIGIAFLSTIYQNLSGENQFISISLNITEEEQKEDSKPFEKEKEEGKEKEFVAVGLTLSPFVCLFENNIFIHNHSKPINGNLSLPFNPPEFI